MFAFIKVIKKDNYQRIFRIMHQKSKHTEINITEKGSLGILALGDIGLRKWREVRNNISKINDEEE